VTDIRPKFLFFLVYNFLKQKNALGGRKIKIKIIGILEDLREKKLQSHLNQLSAKNRQTRLFLINFILNYFSFILSAFLTLGCMPLERQLGQMGRTML
jgi:hypothetical protein